jgi:hypothetical protein
VWYGVSSGVQVRGVRAMLEWVGFVEVMGFEFWGKMLCEVRIVIRGDGLTNRVDKDQREIDLVKTSVRNNDNNLTLRNNDNIHDENLESTDEKCKTRNAQKQPTNFGIPTIFTIIHAETLKKNA